MRNQQYEIGKISVIIFALFIVIVYLCSFVRDGKPLTASEKEKICPSCEVMSLNR
jgi:hypothetical protein